jgi:allantoate deiminase
MAISVDRIRNDIEAIARCTQTSSAGATRPTFSPAWAEARTYVIVQAEQAGCRVRTDAAGNLHARPKSLDWEEPAWLCGSHIDSVPHGGDYDGVAGVCVALELLRSAAQDGVAALPLELVAFAEEEGPTFGLGMLGSRAWAGDLTAEHLGQLRNAAGQTYLEAGLAYGVDAARTRDDLIRPQRYCGMIELHIEQGPGLWRREQRLAVVYAIAGRRQYRVTVTGEANHAGATSMKERKDALVAAARIIGELEPLAERLSGQTVITVGRLNNHPNAINVIPDRVEFTVDLRSDEDTLLERGDVQIRRTVDNVSRGRGLPCRIELTESIPATRLDERLCARLRRMAEIAGVVDVPNLVSGALHDSAVLAPHVPTAMLFIPSRDGISHNPAEFSRVEDIATATGVIEHLVRRPTLRRLNAVDRETFVAVCGPLFEGSPWIAERAWANRPFASVGDLHEKLTQVVASSTEEEQLSLIRAHPDLVGRLAREGRLTRESTAEQAAAGLNSLTDDEIKQFESYNTAYREKFGFPFVICAREGRKEAILAAFPRRLANSREQEIAAALTEIFKIARLRLADAVWED